MALVRGKIQIRTIYHLQSNIFFLLFFTFLSLIRSYLEFILIFLLLFLPPCPAGLSAEIKFLYTFRP